MNRRIPNSKTETRRTGEEHNRNRRRRCCTELAVMMLVLWAASTAAGGIRITQTVHIYGDVTTDFVQISNIGLLIIANGGTLTLTGDPINTSTIDGRIQLYGGSSRLIFSADHTLTGSGYIEGLSNSALIELLGTTTLTASSGFRISGSMEIHAGAGTFRNDGVLEADRGCADCTLTCYNGTFAGSGEYKVSRPGGTLTFRVGISDTDLAADFTVAAGTLDINADVCTSGDLNFTGGQIDIASGTSFQVNQPTQ